LLVVVLSNMLGNRRHQDRTSDHWSGYYDSGRRSGESKRDKQGVRLPAIEPVTNLRW